MQQQNGGMAQQQQLLQQKPHEPTPQQLPDYAGKVMWGQATWASLPRGSTRHPTARTRGHNRGITATATSCPRTDLALAPPPRAHPPAAARKGRVYSARQPRA